MSATDRLDPDPAAPPCDSLAEAVALYLCELMPDLVGRYDLGPLLVCPEHQALWRTMTRIRMQQPDLNGGEFVVAYWRTCWADPYLNRCLALVQSVPKDITAEYERQWEERRDWWKREERLWNHREFDTRPEGLIPSPLPAYPSHMSYWVKRLERCMEARTLIARAQEVAAAAWRLDTGRARFVARQAAQIGATHGGSPEMDIPA